VKIKRTRHLLPAVVLMISCGSYVAMAAQPPAAPSQTPPQTQKTPSAIMQPAIEILRQTIWGVRPEKWKASDEIRQETSSNIDSIHRDLTSTLPSLLTAADQTPDSVSGILPAYRNIEALYDVLLRVVQVANLSAPNQQSAALDHARASLDDARRSLGDHLNSAALAQDQQVHRLQAALRAVPPAPVPVACPPPAPVKKHKTRRKSAKKPASIPATPPSQATAPH
jgi:hypothetical protein